MAAFSIRNPYFIIVICLVVIVLGGVAVLGMPVDLFPAINLPQVVVATFYSGMPPQDIEANIPAPLERFFTLAIRNQIVTVPGVSIAATFGGKYRQIMIHVDPFKLLSRDLSVMDVVDAVNNQNLILPAGDVKMGPYDYY